MKPISLLSAAVLTFCGLVAHAQAHPVHQSAAEVAYNQKTKKLEVSLTVDLNDLELALTRECDHAISLDRTPADEFDAQTQIYLARNFEITDANGQVAKIVWIGRELVAETVKSADPSVRLFFEVPLAGEIAAAQLRHSLFCSLFNEQTNLVHLCHDKTKLELRFLKGDAAKPLVPPAKVSPKP
jgi:hypothetical protein